MPEVPAAAVKSNAAMESTTTVKSATVKSATVSTTTVTTTATVPTAAVAGEDSCRDEQASGNCRYEGEFT
jgi:hypothetical protein